MDQRSQYRESTSNQNRTLHKKNRFFFPNQKWYVKGPETMANLDSGDIQASFTQGREEAKMK